MLILASLHRGASQPAAPGLILGVAENFFDVAEISRQRWSEESGQRLENVDRTYLVLASGKLVIQKGLASLKIPFDQRSV